MVADGSSAYSSTSIDQGARIAYRSGLCTCAATWQGICLACHLLPGYRARTTALIDARCAGSGHVHGAGGGGSCAAPLRSSAVVGDLGACWDRTEHSCRRIGGTDLFTSSADRPGLGGRDSRVPETP